MHAPIFPGRTSLGDSLGCFTTWAEQWTQEEVILAIHLTITIDVNPPSSADIARIARAELGLESDWATHLQ
jgi:hypothetical protein